jgi:segregation and condensation protein B
LNHIPLIMSEIGTQTVSSVESLLFTNGEPLSVSRIAKLLESSETEIEAALTVLGERYLDPLSGLMLVRHGKSVEIATRAENAGPVEELIRTDREENLGKATLEVLAIVAYRGPVTRAKIDAIRGVNCSFALRTLLLRGLVDRHTNPLDNREYEYAPSFRLLELLGIGSLAELPGYADLSRDVRIADLPEEESLSERGEI